MQLKTPFMIILLLLWAGWLPSLARGETAAAASPKAAVGVGIQGAMMGIQRDVEVVDKFGPDRSVGTAGGYKSADYFAKRLEDVTGYSVWRQRFTLAVPVVKYCEAREPGVEKVYGLWPMTPAGGQASAVENNEATTGVVYVGRGLLDELKGKEIANQWVAMDLERANWQTVGGLGAKGVIFLGNTGTSVQDLMDKWTCIPIGMPRFYTDDAALIAGIKTGTIKNLTVRVNVKWEEKQAENLLCLIPGKAKPGKDNAETAKKQEWVKQLIMVQARYDGVSEVQGRAPGAHFSANAAAAVDLAGRLAREDERCSVLVVLTAGDEWMNRGTRNVLEMFRPEKKDAVKSIAELTELAETSVTKADDAQKTLQGVREIAEGNFTSLECPDKKIRKLIRETVQDQLDRQLGQIEVELQATRLVKKTPENKIAIEALLKDRGTAKMERLEASTTVRRQQPLAGRSAELAKIAAQEMVGLWERETAGRTADRDAKQEWLRIRKEIGERDPMLHIQLDLTSGGDRFGFFSRSYYTMQNDLGGRMGPYAQAFRGYCQDAEKIAKERGLFYDCQFEADSMLSTYTLESFFSIRRGFSTDSSLLRGQAAGAFATVADSSGWVDTPNDVPAKINWANYQKQLRDVHWLLLGSEERKTLGALVDPDFYGRVDLTGNTSNQTVTVFERTLGETIPRLAAMEHLVGAEQEKANNSYISVLAGMRRMDWNLSSVNGVVDFLGMSKVANSPHKLQVFRFGEDGRANRIIAQVAVDAKGGLESSFSTPEAKKPKRTMVFDCQRLDLYGLYDPRYLDYLDKIYLLDARRMDKMQFTANYVREGLGVVFMPPQVEWQLLVAKGDIANRMVLVNMASASPERPNGGGFTTVDRTAIGPLAWQNAQDLFALDSMRKNNLEKFGISNELIKDLHAESGKYLASATEGKEQKDYAKWLGDTGALWSLEWQVYANLQATSNGVIHGVIFLLLGIIPFSYFLERLLIGATNVYKQIGGFAGIFALMTAGLWFHPAFRISSAPVMILLAFLILILSSTVVWILFGKFEEEIARLRGAGSASHSASIKRGAVLGAAVRLGLSNMRRRGTRTTLTLLTLVLLTFTLLCFTSVSESLTLTPRVVDSSAKPATGILLRQRGWKGLPNNVETMVRELSGANGVVSERWWACSENPQMPWYLPIVPLRDGATDMQRKAFRANGLVGIDRNEQAFQEADMAQVLPGWERLAAGEAVCLLPEEVQASSGFKVNDEVDILGSKLKVAGFFKSADAQKLRHLTGDELMPVDPSGSANQPGTTSSTSPEDIAAMAEQSYRFWPANQIAFVPAQISRRLNARLTSVMVKPAEGKNIFAVAEGLSRRSAFGIFASDGTQVRSYNASASTRPENLDKVLVPMIIAGVIVLNTMLGAVSERTREIHVYTSLGLAPTHVGTLFLAEAAALGTLGVVFGYIFGQGLASILSSAFFQKHLPIMQGVDLNYSSMSAIVTMGLVLAITMLSSIWPARTATRVAAPSLQRDWKLPPAQGDLLRVDLPFTVNQVAARGVCAFMQEFFVTVTQAGSGRFTADSVRAFNSGTVKGLACRIWLAPYDLGVIQKFQLEIHPTSDHNVFEVRLTLEREAGNPSTWHRLNRPFLVEVRKQFLLWRAVTPELVKVYVERSQEMFAQAQPELLALTPPTTSTAATAG